MVFVNGEYGKTTIYSIRRSVPVEMGNGDEEMPSESPYIILNG